MNKILYIVALSALWVGCQNTAPAGNASTSGDTSEKITIGDHYTIDGTAPVKEGARILLYQYKDRVYTPVDSVALDSQGRFHFEGKTTEPLVYALRLNGSGKRAHLYIENSPMALNNALDLPKEIKEAPASPQLAYFLARNAYRYDFPTLSALRKSLDKSLDNNPYIKELDLALEQLSKIQPGAEAPEIDLVDAQGKKVSLKDFRGKKLLVDFWASWCPDCRKASPELVALYKEQKDKGLEILSISLDEDTSAWQAAIAKDQYTWPQALAKGVWQSDAALTYALRWIPTYMLLDKDGKILSRGIQLSSVISNQ